MIDTKAAQLASRRDRRLLRRIHPLSLPLLDTLAAWRPVVKLPGIGVLVSEAEFCREALVDRQRFSKLGPGVGGGLWTPILGRQGLINMDGEEHKLMKRSLAASFSNAVVPAVVEQVIKDARQSMLARLQQGEAVDVVEEVERFSYRSAWAMLGLPEDTRGLDLSISELKHVIEGVSVTRKEMPASQVRHANEKLARIEQITREAYRAAVDRENVPGVLKAEGYDEEAAVSITKVMMIAGTETIMGFLPRMTALFIDSGFLAQLAEDSTQLPAGVTEAMRFTMPTAVDARIAMVDHDFHGVQVKAGERMLLSLLHSGLRYGNFDPYRGELDRNVRGLWFGAGVHMCIGLPLALAQAEAFAKVLVQAQQEAPVRITRRRISRKGHLGSYHRLEIQCVAS